MLGQEVFLLKRHPKESPLFRVAWYFPHTYAVGMSGLGYQLIWGLMEKEPDVAVSRGFTDVEEAGCEDADLFGFTVSWELDFANVLSILDKQRIPLLSKDRDRAHPLVFGGGPVLTANPEPYAEILDVILLGDAEATIPVFLDTWRRVRGLGARAEQLHQLAQVPGIYVPSLYRYDLTHPTGAINAVVPTSSEAPSLIAKQLYTPPVNAKPAHSLILSPDTAWGDVFLVEVVRSCPQECRFCLASFLTRPFRVAAVETLMETVDQGLGYTKKIGLLGPSVTEHPQFDQIAQSLLARNNAQISIASVRADSLNEEILRMLYLLQQRSVTIAIESGSERSRAIMKKNLSETEILDAVRMIEASGLQGVKFYAMVGLPFEEQSDLDETVRLLRQLKKKHKRLKFVLGVSSFVPKAQTPYQRYGRDKGSKQKLEFIRRKLSHEGVEVRPESHNWSDIQALISRGDRRLTPVLLDAWRLGGSLGAWKRALKQSSDLCPGLDHFAFRQISENEILPWSHIVDPARAQYLEKHSAGARALAESFS